MKKDSAKGWKEDYPTYDFKSPDVVLKEYEFANKTLEADERLFLNAANLTVLLVAAAIPFSLSGIEKALSSLSPAISVESALVLVFLVQILFAGVLLRYFADRHKSVVFASRKVITLRRMLGMNYGSVRLVLPNWRVEAANEPLAVRMFPGWNTSVAFPCYIIAGGASICGLIVAAKIANAFWADASWLVVGVAVAEFILLCTAYRRALCETYENSLLIFTRTFAMLMRVRLADNFEYIIYRAKLAGLELKRLKYQTEKFDSLLVHIEDKTFFRHPGVSIRGLTRMFRSIMGYGKLSGGSTITQQAVRTLFVIDFHKKYRRKAVEILLALWFDKMFDKKTQLAIYTASVRFEQGVMGLPAATKHFFGRYVKKPDVPQAFFLVERLSNIRSRLLTAKIRETLRHAIDASLITFKEVEEILALYRDAVSKGLIVGGEEADISKLMPI